MATITSTGGSVEYVDYKPVSELMEEEGANILLVHLPGEFNLGKIRNHFSRFQNVCCAFSQFTYLTF